MKRFLSTLLGCEVQTSEWIKACIVAPALLLGSMMQEDLVGGLLLLGCSIWASISVAMDWARRIKED